jgi:hypothetical protein
VSDNTPKSFDDFIAKNKAAMAAIDGGPAFPNAKLVEVRCPETGNPQDTYVVPVGGMTLRDYFAALAMQGIITGQVTRQNAEPAYRRIALDAFLMAETMIAVRGGGQ